MVIKPKLRGILEVVGDLSDKNDIINVVDTTVVVADLASKDVYEPLLVKEQIIKSATETASLIPRIDDVIAASKSKGAGAPQPGAGAGGYGGYGGGAEGYGGYEDME